MLYSYVSKSYLFLCSDEWLCSCCRGVQQSEVWLASFSSQDIGQQVISAIFNPSITLSSFAEGWARQYSRSRCAKRTKCVQINHTMLTLHGSLKIALCRFKINPPPSKLFDAIQPQSITRVSPETQWLRCHQRTSADSPPQFPLAPPCRNSPDPPKLFNWHGTLLSLWLFYWLLMVPLGLQ